MQLNMSDPRSILNWWRVYPSRHWAYLAYFAAHAEPQFQAPIRQAVQLIEADPLFDPRGLPRAAEVSPRPCRPGEQGEEALSDAGTVPADGRVSH